MAIKNPKLYHDTDNCKRIFKNALKNLYPESFDELPEKPQEDFLFTKIEEFFNYLFADNAGKPLDERCYIVIARKGFSIWLAGMLCGLTGNTPLGPDKLISDRCWKKMSSLQRRTFVSGKHVYIVDDSVITGTSAQSVYFDISVVENEDDVHEGFAKSINVAFLSSEYDYDYSIMFHEYYKGTFPVTIEQRRFLNERIMSALYKLSVPYTAESPTYRVVMSKAEFKTWRNPTNKWRYIATPLDFGSAGVIENSFFLRSPDDIRFGDNFLLRGMRICYSDCDEEHVIITLVPWIIFDVIDYNETIKYLLSLVYSKDCFADPEKTFLYSQLTHGETKRKQVIVHRVISYLYDLCIANEFVKDFLQKGEYLFPFTLPNGVELGRYHYEKELYDEIKQIEKSLCVCVDYNDKCPANTKPLFIDSNKHKELASALCKMSYHQMSIPKRLLPVVYLEDSLCSQREISNDKNGIPTTPVAGKQHPLLCYYDNEYGERSDVILRLIRRSIGSLHSAIISYKGRSYLLNTLVSGESSPLAFVKNYDFIYALHSFVETEWYSRGKEELFFNKWNELRNKEPRNTKPRLSFVSEKMINTLSSMSPPFWPSIELISLTYSAKENLPDDHIYKQHLPFEDIDIITDEIINELQLTS